MFGKTYTDTLSQFDLVTGQSTAAQRTAAAGANLVNFLRGQTGFAGYVAGDVTKLYRNREGKVLGDITNSQLQYVKAPSGAYETTATMSDGSIATTDPGYKDFKAAWAGRSAMAYVGANDGMLHAFYAPKNIDANWADRGKEAWAVIPSTVAPNLFKLADVAYGSSHIYFVDGSPVTGDVDTAGNGTAWKTILVGGLNKGGRAFYAMDITDPSSPPKALWEFKGVCGAGGSPVGQTSDCNLGLSFGRPVITKMAPTLAYPSGRWVVLLSSGYNNVSPGDGRGYLYVLDAGTGQIVKRMVTSAGDTGTPSGLRELTTYVSNVLINNTTKYVYGGDLLGNVWRFDINGSKVRSCATVHQRPQRICRRGCCLARLCSKACARMCHSRNVLQSVEAA